MPAVVLTSLAGGLRGRDQAAARHAATTAAARLQILKLSAGDRPCERLAVFTQATSGTASHRLPSLRLEQHRLASPRHDRASSRPEDSDDLHAKPAVAGVA